MALVGSISGSSGLTAVTSSFIPSASTFNLGSSGNKWGTVYANYMTASISSSDGTNPFLTAGPDISVRYNSLGQWEITGTAAPAVAAQDIFKAIDASTAYSTSSIAIGFNGAPSSKGSNIFFAVSGSNAASNKALFSGDVITSGSLFVKDDVNANVNATISNAGVISGSALQSAGDLAVNGSNVTSTSTTFNLLNSGVTTALNIGGAATTTTVGSPTGRVVVPGDLEVQGTTMTVSASNLVIEDPLIGLGFLSGSVATSAGDRGFVGGIVGAGNNVAFVWSNSNSAFAATKTTSTPADTTVNLTTLQPIRASTFQVNGTVAAIKEDTGSVIVSGSTVFLDSATSITRFMQAGFNDSLRVVVSDAQNPLILGNAGGLANQSVILSGTSVVVDSSDGAASFKKGALAYVNVVTSSYTTPAGTTGNAALVTARDGIAAVFGGTSTTVVSGSAVNLNAGSLGARIQRDGTTFANFTSGSGATATLSTINGTSFTVGTNTTGILNLSGSNGVNLNAPAATGVSFQSDGTPMLKVSSPASNQVSIDTLGSFSTLTIAGTDGTITNLNLGTGAETLTIGEANSTTTFGGAVVPGADITYDLGSASLRWKNVYTGDLHLRNERGDYTLIEEEDFLSIRFNKTGKRYKFVLEPVPELDE